MRAISTTTQSGRKKIEQMNVDNCELEAKLGLSGNRGGNWISSENLMNRLPRRTQFKVEELQLKLLLGNPDSITQVD